LVAVLARAYAKENFVVVGQQIPSTKATVGTNVTQLTVLAALDNLTKGASGGAVQAANVALGLPEESGLAMVGMFP
jgi:N-acetyl-gamma-glutamyl-phosphate reductase